MKIGDECWVLVKGSVNKYKRKAMITNINIKRNTISIRYEGEKQGRAISLSLIQEVKVFKEINYNL